VHLPLPVLGNAEFAHGRQINATGGLAVEDDAGAYRSAAPVVSKASDRRYVP
jgi:hypothetical protein